MMGSFKGGSDDDVNECPSEPSMALAHHILNNMFKFVYRQALNQVTEFEIVAVDSNLKNKSPILHMGRSLGLESWCVELIYNYAYSKLMRSCFSRSKRKRVTRSNFKSVNVLLCGALLFNPAIVTFWNLRREMVIRKYLKYGDEFHFVKVVLSHKPKSHEAFSYRRWLFKKFIYEYKNAHYTFIYTDLEMELSKMCAEKCSNNYHAWSHRVWVLNLLTEWNEAVAQSIDELNNNISHINYKFLVQMSFSKDWISTHISDHSAFHFRQFCISKIMTIDDFIIEAVNFMPFEKEPVNLHTFMQNNLAITDLVAQCSGISNAAKFLNMILGQELSSKTDLFTHERIYRYLSFLIDELRLNLDCISRFETHEVLLGYRKFIIHRLVLFLYKYFEKEMPKTEAPFVLNEMFEKCDDTSVNITKALLAKSNAIDDGSLSGSKISKLDNYSVFDNLLCYALSASEKNAIANNNKIDPLLLKYEIWLKHILKFPFK